MAILSAASASNRLGGLRLIGSLAGQLQGLKLSSTHKFVHGTAQGSLGLHGGSDICRIAKVRGSIVVVVLVFVGQGQ
jgi:hypothetical protein